MNKYTYQIIHRSPDDNGLRPKFKVVVFSSSKSQADVEVDNIIRDTGGHQNFSQYTKEVIKVVKPSASYNSGTLIYD